MIDIHSHLLYGVDDGAKTIEESIEVLKDLKAVGYSDIILTPHYIKDSSYNSNKKNNLTILKKLKTEIKKNKLNINVYLGNEIYIDNNIEELLKTEEITSLNDSKYLLIELPMSGEYLGYQDIFANLINLDYKVILAHPERYLSFQKDYKKVEELAKIGVCFQCNMESILGKYGRHAKKLIKKMLKKHQVMFLATDIHHKKHNYDDYLEAKRLILKYINEDEYNKLVFENANNVIN